MRQFRSTATIFIAISFALVGVAQDQQVAERTAYSFDEVQSEAKQLGAKHGTDKVLLVFDIDNTLLAMNQDLGSDQWFAWQDELPDNHSAKVGNFGELLRVQALLYEIYSMRATEPVIQPSIVKQMQDAGFPTLLLTSRGYINRDATERELLSNGYDFSQSAFAKDDKLGREFEIPYFPYDENTIELSGITRAEAEEWIPDPDGIAGLKKPRPVSYENGIYMTAGQNKGMVLRMLLHKTGNAAKFKYIIFVDDQPKHTETIRKAFARSDNPEAVTFRYAREDANVRRFEENHCCEKYCAVEALCELRWILSLGNRSNVNPPTYFSFE